MTQVSHMTSFNTFNAAKVMPMCCYIKTMSYRFGIVSMVFAINFFTILLLKILQNFNMYRIVWLNVVVAQSPHVCY